MEKDNHKLLVNWLAGTLADNPEIIAGDVAEVYAKLHEVWLREIQPAFKLLIKIAK